MRSDTASALRVKHVGELLIPRPEAGPPLGAQTRVETARPPPHTDAPPRLWIHRLAAPRHPRLIVLRLPEAMVHQTGRWVSPQVLWLGTPLVDGAPTYASSAHVRISTDVWEVPDGVRLLIIGAQDGPDGIPLGPSLAEDVADSSVASHRGLVSDAPRRLIRRVERVECHTPAVVEVRSPEFGEEIGTFP